MGQRRAWLRLIGQERIEVSAQDTHPTLADPNSSQLTAINHVPLGRITVFSPALITRIPHLARA
jgi:hypothetical protein